MNDVARRVAQLLGTPAPWPIEQAGADVLRRQALPVAGQLSPKDLEALVEGMRITMARAPGVGLAAPQVGIGLALAVAQDSGVGRKEDGGRLRRGLPFQVWINPVYRPVGSEIATFEEGCLSISGWCALRPRHLRVSASYTDLSGRRHDEELEGWNARIFQHETDHLAGRLYIDGAQMSSFRSEPPARFIPR